MNSLCLISGLQEFAVIASFVINTHWAEFNTKVFVINKTIHAYNSE